MSTTVTTAQDNTNNVAAVKLIKKSEQLVNIPVNILVVIQDENWTLQGLINAVGSPSINVIHTSQLVDIDQSWITKFSCIYCPNNISLEIFNQAKTLIYSADSSVVLSLKDSPGLSKSQLEIIETYLRNGLIIKPSSLENLVLYNYNIAHEDYNAEVLRICDGFDNFDDSITVDLVKKNTDRINHEEGIYPPDKLIQLVKNLNLTGNETADVLNLALDQLNSSDYFYLSLSGLRRIVRNHCLVPALENSDANTKDQNNNPHLNESKSLSFDEVSSSKSPEVKGVYALATEYYKDNTIPDLIKGDEWNKVRNFLNANGYDFPTNLPKEVRKLISCAATNLRSKTSLSQPKNNKLTSLSEDAMLSIKNIIATSYPGEIPKLYFNTLLSLFEEHGLFLEDSDSMSNAIQRVIASIRQERKILSSQNPFAEGSLCYCMYEHLLGEYFQGVSSKEYLSKFTEKFPEFASKDLKSAFGIVVKKVIFAKTQNQVFDSNQTGSILKKDDENLNHFEQNSENTFIDPVETIPEQACEKEFVQEPITSFEEFFVTTQAVSDLKNLVAELETQLLKAKEGIREGLERLKASPIKEKALEAASAINKLFGSENN